MAAHFYLGSLAFSFSSYRIFSSGDGAQARMVVQEAISFPASDSFIREFCFLHIWQHYLARSTWYQKGMLTSYQSLAGRWESWLTHYLYSYPYVLVYPVALAALLGLIMTIVKSRRLLRRWIWLAFFGYFLVGTFYALVVNKWWTPRYQYTLVVLALVPAGYGLSWLWGWKKIKMARQVGSLSLFIRKSHLYRLYHLLVTG